MTPSNMLRIKVRIHMKIPVSHPFRCTTTVINIISAYTILCVSTAAPPASLTKVGFKKTYYLTLISSTNEGYISLQMVVTAQVLQKLEMGFCVSHRLSTKFALVGFYDDISNKSIPIGADPTSIELPNCTIIIISVILHYFMGEPTICITGP